MSKPSERLKELLGEDQWKLLQKKGTALADLHYVVACETCGTTFFDSTLQAVQDMMLNGQWDPHQPQMWYVHAGKHWIPQKFHSIRIFVTDGQGDKSLIKDLTTEWKALVSSQAKKLKKGLSIDQAMLSELDYLEQQISRRSHSTS